MGLQDLVGDKRKTNTIAVKGSTKSKHVLWNLVTFSVTFLTSVEEEKKEKAAVILRHNLTYFASAQPLFGDHILPSPISPRARWESGARSPLAPTVPFSGTKERQEAAEGKCLSQSSSY